MPLTGEQPLTIVLGTSRCGSTMLSRLLSLHPDVLSSSEFWDIFLRTGDDIPGHDMTGEDFWQRLSRIAPALDDLVTSGVTSEGVQPFPSRFNDETGTPSVARVLNWLTREPPDPLYDELAPLVLSWPKRPMADHCYALFAYLATRFGRGVIVDWTGGSLDQVRFLLRNFPDARYVFLHRDGPDTALSMSRLPASRLAVFRYLAAVAAGQLAPLDPEIWPADLKSARPEDYAGLAGPPFDRERFMSYPLPLAIFGYTWSTMTRKGTSEIRRVRRDGLLTMRYELLLTQTRAELTRLAGFIGIPADSPAVSPETWAQSPDHRWLDLACQFVDSGRSGSAEAQLHPIDLTALRGVCVPGSRAFELLESEQPAGR